MANLKHLSPGKLPEVNVVIEIPQGSRVKYELDDTGVIKVDRILSSAGYPANYGFIPSTLFDDGDPLDVVLISNHALSPIQRSESRCGCPVSASQNWGNPPGGL